MPSLLNPYSEFFHCAGEEFQYEMDVANEVVDSSKATIMMPSTPNRRYTAPNGSPTATAARPELMRSDSDSIVGCPPSPSPSVEFHDHPPPQAGGVAPAPHHDHHMHKASRS